MQEKQNDNNKPIVVILTAIPLEYMAIRDHLSNIKEDVTQNGTIYEIGAFNSDNQEWIVIIRQTGQGNVSAANAVHLAWQRYLPDVMIFCGIAGGIKDVKIGDVVVADKVYNYHSGKTELSFSARPQIYTPSHAIMERANLEGQNWKLTKSQIIDDQSILENKVYIKPIASGELLIAAKESEPIKQIYNHCNDAIAIDMEGYGFLNAVQECGVNERLLIRGISDLIETKSETDKQGGQEIAAANAADFTFQILKKFTPPSKIQRNNISNVQSPEKKSKVLSINSIIKDAEIEDRKLPELNIIDQFRSELKNKGIFKIEEKERIRLFLLAGSLLPYSVGFNELGNHILHKIYLYRNNINLTYQEQYLIYTTLLRDSFNYKTGWFWLRKIKIRQLVKHLEEDAIYKDGNEKSREDAIKILQTIKSNIVEDSLIKIVQKCEHTNKRNILDYLFVYGSIKSLDVVNKLTVGEHEGITSKAIIAKIGILSRIDPSKAVSVIIEEAEKDNKLLQELSFEKICNFFNVHALRKLANYNFVFALKELAKRNKGTSEELQLMIKSDIPEIRYLGYSRLFKLGYKFDPNEIQTNWPRTQTGRYGFFGLSYQIQGMEWMTRTLLESYLKMPINELEGSLELRRQKAVIYLAWGLKGGRSIINIVRNDINNAFERHKNDILLKIKSINNDTEEEQKEKNSLINMEKSITNDLTVSALKILEMFGNASDKIIANEYVKSEITQLRISAKNLFIKYASKKDIHLLFDIANSGDSYERIAASQKILDISTNNKDISDLLELNYENVIKVVLLWHIDNQIILSWEKISKLFYSKNDDIRILATAYIINTYKRKKIESLLEIYVNSKTYYYDVVCWLDRYLYTPKKLSQGYKNILSDKLCKDTVENHLL